MTLNRKILKRVHSPLKSPKRNNTSLRKKALIKQLSSDVQFGVASKANVKVVVRIRPYNSRELDNGERSIVKVVDSHMMIFDPKVEEDDFFFKGVRQRTRDLNRRPHKEQKFIFEKVFDESSNNQMVYEEATRDIIDTILLGYNCSVFAYGATGSGKTFTMLGKPDSPGITFLTLMELYGRIDEVKEEKTIEVGVSYLEVYNETVRDLLEPGKLLNVQENGTRVLVPGLSLHKPKDADDLLKMLAFGNQNRTQHPTDANAESSRSHAVFQIFVRQQDRTANLKSNVSIAKLSMIDLAGSERGTATGFKGVRFREGASINKSLLALGNCINALADGLRHVPYRDSKLTRLLKDSLGGNCRSVMIAAVSPAVSSFEDTFNTLRYANRAKTIKTTLKKNLMNVDQHVTQYVKIVEDLRSEICSLKNESESNKAALQLANEALKNQNELEDEIAHLKQELEERPSTAAAIESAVYTVGVEEHKVHNSIAEATSERKALRRELLQLESSQREMEVKIHNSTLRLQRMKIVSFASQRLDKSIAKCERTIRNFTSRLEQTKQLQKNVEIKLDANLKRLQALHNELNQWGPGGCEPSQPSRLFIEKNESAVAERDLAQFAKYLSGLVKEGAAEQSASEQFIGQLLLALMKFYVQLRANNASSPEMERLFEGVIDSMDESKIIWADQQSSDSQDASKPPGNETAPTLDLSRITLLPVLSDYISPTMAQDNTKIFRRSIMKGSNSSICLPNTTATVLQEMESHTIYDIKENEASLDNSQQVNTTPESPVLSEYCTDVEYTHKPSPLIGGSHLAIKPRILDCELSPELGISIVPEPRVPFSTTALSTPSVSHAQLSPMLQDQKVPNRLNDFKFVSMTNEENALGCDDLNATELLENIQPVEYSMNATFGITPAKILNTTIDMPKSVNCLNTTVDLPKKPSVKAPVSSNLSTTKAFKTEEPSVWSTIKTLNTTMDLPRGDGTFVCDITAEDIEKNSSRKLFPSGIFEETFSLENSHLGCSVLEGTSPDISSKSGHEVQKPRSPLAPLENITPALVREVPTVSIVINCENPMPPPSSTKKGIIKKSGLTPHKTPAKTPASVKTKGFFSASKTGGMRRSVSTSALLSTSALHASSVCNGKQGQMSPVLKRKYNALGGALRRTSSFLKSRPNNKNQENLPPGNSRAYTSNYKPVVQKETISSMAKQVSHGLQKT